MKKSFWAYAALTAVALTLMIPGQSIASKITDANRYFQAAYTNIKTQRLNVQNKLWSNVGPVRVKDKLNVSKRIRAFGNMDLRGELINNGTGVVRVNDKMWVGDAFQTGHIDFSTTNISTLNTSTLSGGDIFLNSADFKLYLWNGNSWVDLTQQNTNTTYSAGTGINLNGTQFSVNQAFSPTWTGDHTFTKDPAIENTEPLIQLNATRSSDINFQLKNDTQAGQAYNQLIIGQDDISENSEKIMTFNPQYKITQAWNNTVLATGGTDSVISSLSIAAGGCTNPNQVSLDGSPDLSLVTVFDVFVDEIGNRFSISSIDDSSDILGIYGTCVQDGSDDALVARDNLITAGGNVGINLNPYIERPYADLHINNTLLLEPTATASQPACDAQHEGMIYADSNLKLTCYCDGSGWVQMDDFVTGC